VAGLLVVTSKSTVAHVLLGALSARGFEVAHVESGEAAVKAASGRVPEVILIDPALSAMDRWHAVKRLAADPRTNRVPVLTLSSDVETSAGLQRVIQKLERTLHLNDPRDPPSGSESASASPGPATARPAEGTASPAGPSRRREDAPSAGGAPHGRGYRILVVDDTPMNRDTLSRRLERKGYEVQAAQGGEEALLALARRPYDLVVLDWTMPGMDGMEVLRRIRESWTPTELPVIMATAKSDAEDLVEALRAEANDFVTKPLNFDVVHARIKTQLALSDSHRELKASEQRYRALLENTGDMVVQFRPGGSVTYVSPACKTLLGIEPDVLRRRPFLEWLHPADRRALEEQYRNQGGWPPAFTFLARMERQDKQWIWVETSARVLRDGPQLVVQAACRDVTEHVERATADEPPLPLGGDIMAHPGWRGGPARGSDARDSSGPARGEEIDAPERAPVVIANGGGPLQAKEPSGNGAEPATPLVFTVMVADLGSMSHDEVIARLSEELRRALGAKR
jgi:PAS domain S-box-containing protein